MNLITEILNAWGWVGIQPVAIIAENDFGNLIIEDTFGEYWRLCPEDVYCKIVAKDKYKLDELLKDQNFAADWNMTALVDLAKNSVGRLDEGQKYCLVIPSVLGGTYDVLNIKSVSLLELIRFSGHLGEQIQNLPDGQPIELKITS